MVPLLIFRLLRPALLTEARLAPVVAMQRVAGELQEAEARFTAKNPEQAGGLECRLRGSSTAPVAPFQLARQFLTNLSLFQRSPTTGLLPLRVLPRRAAVWRDLRLLDRLPARQTVRVACLYVAPGQRQEAEIIMNEEGSAAYVSLLHSLAWQVPLPKEAEQEEGDFYTGGLSAEQTKDGLGFYWESPLAELILHDGCSLRGDAIRRKRHLGNDAIQLVWSEHCQDYDPLTLTGDCCLVCLVLYPVARWPGAVRVQIWTRPGLQLPPFGPLQSGCLVARAELPTLLQATLLAAHQAIQQQQQQQQRPFLAPWEQRRTNLTQLIDRWALANWSLEQVLQYAMFADAPLPDELISQPEEAGDDDGGEDEGSRLQLAEMKAELEEISQPAISKQPETPKAENSEIEPEMEKEEEEEKRKLE